MRPDPAPTSRVRTRAAIPPTLTPSLVRPGWMRSTPSSSRAATAVVTVLAPHERARVDAAGQGCYIAVHRDSIDEALQDLRQCRAEAVLVSVSYCGAQASTAVARMVREFPAVPAVALLSEAHPQATHAVLALGQYGVRSLVDVRDASGWRTLRQLLGAERSERIVHRALDRIDRELADAPEDGRRFLAGCFLAPARVSTVRALARRLGVGASTLMSRFYRAGLPAPKRYLAYARLVKAASLFENPGLSISQVAHAMEFSSPQSFGRHVQTMLGLSALRFRQTLDGPAMLDRLVAELVVPYRDTLRVFRPLVVLPTWSREGDDAMRETRAAGDGRVREAR